MTVASIIKQHTEAFIRRYGKTIAPHVESTLLRIGLCRTAPLGGRVYECDTCGERTQLYNSCTDRHCPQCMGARRADWTERTSRLLDKSATYFQVVFTLPEKLSSLVLGNRRELYKLLFQASWDALAESITQERGLKPAASMVLHTWNQRLGHHPHVHAIVPGSGPSLDGQRWLPCRMTKATREKPARPILVDYKRLARRFRDAYIAGIRGLIRQGQLKVQDPAQLEIMLCELAGRDWVVYIQPPPKQAGDPEHVVKYLARYMTGGPISDSRLIKIESGYVHFWARATDKSRRSVPTKLPILEFVRSWCLHVIPKRFTKVRSFGAWSNKHRRAYWELGQRLNPAPADKEQPTTADTQPIEPPEDECRRCRRCAAQQQDSPMRLIAITPRPPWRELFYGPDHPVWFEMIWSSA